MTIVVAGLGGINEEYVRTKPYRTSFYGNRLKVARNGCVFECVTSETLSELQGVIVNAVQAGWSVVDPQILYLKTLAISGTLLYRC